MLPPAAPRRTTSSRPHPRPETGLLVEEPVQNWFLEEKTSFLDDDSSKLFYPYPYEGAQPPSSRLYATRFYTTLSSMILRGFLHFFNDYLNVNHNPSGQLYATPTPSNHYHATSKTTTPPTKTTTPTYQTGRRPLERSSSVPRPLERFYIIFP